MAGELVEGPGALGGVLDVLGNLVGEEVGEQVPLNLDPCCLGLAAQTALEKAVADTVLQVGGTLT